MEPVILYIKLSKEFESKLNRKLTNNEEEFLKWIVQEKRNEEKCQEEKSTVSC